MDEFGLRLEDASKFYRLYDSPRDRLKEALHPFGRKRHREFYALKNINLTVSKGEILGIVGRNGSGKSTLLQIVAGVIPANSGRVSVNGNVSAMLDLGAGMNPDFDGIQNIFFGGIMLGYSREEIKRRIDEIVAFADIGSFINQPLRTYSSGMKARLGFALAVSVDPQILLIDEVLAVGDDLFRRKCYGRMEAMIKTGCTVLFVTHNTSTVDSFCTRAILLDQGELLLDGSPMMVTRYYHKLLYVDRINAREVRQEILELNRDKNAKLEYAERTNKAGSLQEEEPASREGMHNAIPYFIGGFAPTTTTYHLLKEIEIKDARIETEAGERVNVLVFQESYVIIFKVHFHQTVRTVRFSSLIQNNKGLSIAGFSHPTKNSERVSLAENGDVFEIRHTFTCSLLPGTYFVSMEVSSLTQDGDNLPVYRVNDLLAFKVQNTGESGQWGLVGLSQTGAFTPIEHEIDPEKK